MDNNKTKIKTRIRSNNKHHHKILEMISGMPGMKDLIIELCNKTEMDKNKEEDKEIMKLIIKEMMDLKTKKDGIKYQKEEAEVQEFHRIQTNKE